MGFWLYQGKSILFTRQAPSISLSEKSNVVFPKAKFAGSDRSQMIDEREPSSIPSLVSFTLIPNAHEWQKENAESRTC
jgi:hypothetical protein